MPGGGAGELEQIKKEGRLRKWGACLFMWCELYLRQMAG